MPQAFNSTYCSSREPKFNPNTNVGWFTINHLLTLAAGDPIPMAYMGTHAQVHTPDTQYTYLKIKQGGGSTRF